MTVTQLPSRNVRPGARQFLHSLSGVGTLRKAGTASDEESGKIVERGRIVSSDYAPLIGAVPNLYGAIDALRRKGQLIDGALLGGGAHSTWQTEAKLLGTSSRSLIVTFLLQYSLLVTSIFTVGHLGRVELAAVSLATSKSALSALITCLPALMRP